MSKIKNHIKLWNMWRKGSLEGLEERQLQAAWQQDLTDLYRFER